MLDIIANAWHHSSRKAAAAAEGLLVKAQDLMGDIGSSDGGRVLLYAGVTGSVYDMAI